MSYHRRNSAMALALGAALREADTNKPVVERAPTPTITSVYFECRDLHDSTDLQDVAKAVFSVEHGVWQIVTSWKGAVVVEEAETWAAAQRLTKEVLRKRARSRGRRTCRMTCDIVVV